MAPWPALCATPASAPASGEWRLLQCIDRSADQQEGARDHAVGVQLGAQAVNRGGGVLGRELRVQQLTMDRSDASLQGLVQRLRSDSTVLGLVGTVGEQLGLRCIEALRQAALPIAHVGPWIADPRIDDAADVVPLFASRPAQMQFALQSLQSVGMRQLGLVYDSPQTQGRIGSAVLAGSAQLGLQVRSWTAAGPDGVEALVARLPSDAPPVLAFIGGAIELARFVQALGARRLLRYVVSLADADFSLLTQLGVTRLLPLVLTQVVPNPQNNQSAFARQYRTLLKDLYDEAPSPMGLAGYVTARYAATLLGHGNSPPTRAGLLKSTALRPAADIDGYALRFNGPGRRGSTFVTQTMVSRDGRLLG